MEGWVELGGWMVTYWDSLPVHRQLPIQAVTGPSIEQLLIATKMLTTTLQHHQSVGQYLSVA